MTKAVIYVSYSWECEVELHMDTLLLPSAFQKSTMLKEREALLVLVTATGI